MTPAAIEGVRSIALTTLIEPHETFLAGDSR